MSDKLNSNGPLIETFMGLTPDIDKTAFVLASAVVSGAVRIGKDASIWHNVTLRGDANSLPSVMAQTFKIIAVFILILLSSQPSLEIMSR